MRFLNDGLDIRSLEASWGRIACLESFRNRLIRLCVQLSSSLIESAANTYKISYCLCPSERL